MTLIKDLDIKEIKSIQQDIQKRLFNDDKMQKQSISLSVILTADQLATDYLFKDEQYISLDEAKQILIDRNELSDNERCYRYVLDKIAMNPSRFDVSETKIEKWGVIENGYAIIYSAAFSALCQDAGFSKKSFLSWADRKGIVQTEAKRLDKVKNFNGNRIRCVFLKLDDGTDKNGFMDLDTEQMELPFD